METMEVVLALSRCGGRVMLITSALLRRHRACLPQMVLFRPLYPRGLQPTVEALTEAACAGLDVWWAVDLLPTARQVAYALACARHVEHLSGDCRVRRCLALVERYVMAPPSVTSSELRAAAADGWKALLTAQDVAAAEAAGAAADAATAARSAADADLSEAELSAAGAADGARAAALAAAEARAGAAAAAALEAEREFQLALLSSMLQEVR